MAPGGDRGTQEKHGLVVLDSAWLGDTESVRVHSVTEVGPSRKSNSWLLLSMFSFSVPVVFNLIFLMY